MAWAVAAARRHHNQSSEMVTGAVARACQQTGQARRRDV